MSNSISSVVSFARDQLFLAMRHGQGGLGLVRTTRTILSRVRRVLFANTEVVVGTHRAVRIAASVLLWLVTVLVALTFGKAGYSKFADAAGWQYWFQRWGFAPWFATVIGVGELGGAALLLVPRLAPYAAAILIAIMLGAFYTVTTKVTDLSSLDPAINIVLLSIVLIGRWPQRLWPRKAG